MRKSESVRGAVARHYGERHRRLRRVKARKKPARPISKVSPLKPKPKRARGKLKIPILGIALYGKPKPIIKLPKGKSILDLPLVPKKPRKRRKAVKKIIKPKPRHVKKDRDVRVRTRDDVTPSRPLEKTKITRKPLPSRKVTIKKIWEGAYTVSVGGEPIREKYLGMFHDRKYPTKREAERVAQRLREWEAKRAYSTYITHGLGEFEKTTKQIWEHAETRPKIERKAHYRPIKDLSEILKVRPRKRFVKKGAPIEEIKEKFKEIGVEVKPIRR